MKIALYSSPRNRATREGIDSLLEALWESGLEYQVNDPFADRIRALTGVEVPPHMRYREELGVAEDVEVLVSYGGDGTFLGAVRMLNNRRVPIIGINSGRLGFLANIAKTEMVQAFEELKARNYTLQERSLLQAKGDFIEQPDYPYAFNELTIQRQGANMIVAEVYVDGEMLFSCHGDGILVSTPSGSTAYSLSVGGPVVAPDSHCFVISPIAPHNLTMRPVVVPDSSVITLRVKTREEGFYVSLDNRNYSAESGATFCVRKAEHPIVLVRLPDSSFYDTLRNKMMWGLDRRDQGK